MINKISIKLEEASTWRAISWFIGALLAIIDPAKSLTFLSVSALIAGTIGILFKDSKSTTISKIANAIDEGIPNNAPDK